MSKIFILILALFLVGCVTTESLKTETRFQSYLGAKKLEKESSLCLTGNALYKRKIPRLELRDADWGGCSKLEASLPEGETVVFNDVIRTNLLVLFYTEHWFLVGTIKVDNTQKDFYYYLGVNDCCNNEPPFEKFNLVQE